MAIEIQTRNEILNDLQAYLKARQPNIILTVDTDEGALLEMVAEAIYGLQVLLRAIEGDVYATTATSTALDEHAKTRLATAPRKGATTSRGIAALRVTGTPGSVIPAGEPLTHADGTQFETEDENTIPGGGTIDVDVSSVTTGTVANKSSGESLQFDSPPAGVNTVATLVADVDGAVDQESDEELRVRLLQAFESPPAGGRATDYWAWAMAVVGVDAAYIHEVTSLAPNGPRGKGTVDIYILAPGTGLEREPPPALVAAVEDTILENAPIGAEPEIYDPAAATTPVDVQVEPQVGYEFDWTGSGTVQSWSSPDITWTAALPQSLMDQVDAVGSARIWCAGELMTVVAYNFGTSKTTLSPVPTATPTGSIYPAGPLSTPIATVITVLFDTLGPGRGITASPSILWEDELKVADLYRDVRSVTGVDDVVVVTPVANVTPISEGAFLIAGVLTIRPL